MTDGPGFARTGWAMLASMTLESLALALVIVLIAPAALVAAWRIWPRGKDARALDAVWTIVPPVLLVVLVVLSAGAGL